MNSHQVPLILLVKQLKSVSPPTLLTALVHVHLISHQDYFTDFLKLFLLPVLFPPLYPSNQSQCDLSKM